MWHDFISAVQRIDVAALDRDELGELAGDIGSARAVLDGLEARTAVALRRLGASEATTAETLRRRTGCSSREARHRARRAETLDQMPNVAEALSSGRLTGEHASALARAAAETSPEAVDGDAGLLAAAEAVPADLASHKTRDWTRRHQTGDDLNRLHQWQRRNRSLNFTEGHGDMLNGIAKFDRVSGAQFQAVVEALADRLYRADGGRDNPNARTRTQCRLDALLALVGIEPVPPPTNGRDLGGGEVGGFREGRGVGGGEVGGFREGRGVGGGEVGGFREGRGVGGGEVGGFREGRGRGRLRSPGVPRLAALVGGRAEAADGSGPDASSELDRLGTEHPSASLDFADPPAGDIRDDDSPGGPCQPGRESKLEAGSAGSSGDRANGKTRGDLSVSGGDSSVGPGGPDGANGTTHGGLRAGSLGRQPGAAVWPGCTCGRGLGVRGQLSIVLDVPYLASNGKQGRCEIPGIGEIARSELERRACDADIYGLIFSSDGLPLNHGRKTRTVSPQQWRVLVARDRGCVICGARPDWCQAHHVKPWLRGGRTDIDNLALVCHGHHRWIHDNDITLRPTSNGWRAPPGVTVPRSLA